ncbi:MAG: phosphotransferase-like protein [Nocardioides sp.]
MTTTGILLYGPPASGKDTVTGQLHRINSRYQLFHRLKAGPGNRGGYRMLNHDHLDALDQAGDLIWINPRYNARYAVDHSGLTDALNLGIPVVHLGQPEACDTIQHALPHTRWITVELRCPRGVAEQRLRDRDPAALTERLAAWDQTPPLNHYDLRIDTSTTTAPAAAAQIDHHTTALPLAHPRV